MAPPAFEAKLLEKVLLVMTILDLELVAGKKSIAVPNLPLIESKVVSLIKTSKSAGMSM